MVASIIAVLLAFFAGYYTATGRPTAITAQQEAQMEEGNMPFKMEVFGPEGADIGSGAPRVEIHWDGNVATVIEYYATDCHSSLQVKSAKYYIEGNTIHIVRELVGNNVNTGESGVRMNCVWGYRIRYVFHGLDRKYEFVIER